MTENNACIKWPLDFCLHIFLCIKSHVADYGKFSMVTGKPKKKKWFTVHLIAFNNGLDPSAMTMGKKKSGSCWRPIVLSVRYFSVRCVGFIYTQWVLIPEAFLVQMRLFFSKTSKKPLRLKQCAIDFWEEWKKEKKEKCHEQLKWRYVVLMVNLRLSNCSFDYTLTHEVFADLALFCASVALYAPLVIKEIRLQKSIRYVIFIRVL